MLSRCFVHELEVIPLERSLELETADVARLIWPYDPGERLMSGELGLPDKVTIFYLRQHLALLGCPVYIGASSCRYRWAGRSQIFCLAQRRSEEEIETPNISTPPSIATTPDPLPYIEDACIKCRPLHSMLEGLLKLPCDCIYCRICFDSLVIRALDLT